MLFQLDYLTVIRKLASDELHWFLVKAYSFLGHSDPNRFVHSLISRMSDLDSEARKCLIYKDENKQPLAGIVVLAPQKDASDQNLYISNLWYSSKMEDALVLLEHIQRKYAYEAIHYPLYNHNKQLISALEPIFYKLGFDLNKETELEFKLNSLPPLGRPLVLESWTHKIDKKYRQIYNACESQTISDEAWAYLKRKSGSFNPNLWFLVSEGLDQEPIGYSFYSAKGFAVDTSYDQSGVGVLPEYRNSSEMLKRLVLSSMHELAAISPFGTVKTRVDGDDKLIRIFEGLGFESLNTYHAFVKKPS